MKVYHMDGAGTYAHLVTDLLEAPVIHTGEWQGLDTSGSKLHATHELEDVSLVWEQLPNNPADAIPAVDTPWAIEHFHERVEGIPHNPAPSHLRWPYAVRGNADHTDDGARFDHTYPERFWPKHAGHFKDEDYGQPVVPGTHEEMCEAQRGIRFPYGDLEDVVNLLATKPSTRQAFLPVWFPEDTGAAGGLIRVPCTLGYHFMIRDNRLTTRYYIRSCDAYRHLSNDVWLAARLAQWVVAHVNAKREDFGHPLEVGGLLMHITSLHAFVADRQKIQARVEAVTQ